MYVVFARKYRPKRFEEVVGQEHVASTLKNAVKNDRVAHAYLFCGSRGVGKTTMARILAKSLDCEQGPTPEPCGDCEACRRIDSGDYVDVMEIDGASNRGIDQIRELRQKVQYAPARSRYKLYYIDEVHMLTAEAFNALLKTLEEPPKHVKFIFSTTDPQNLPDTVKSRCQRFDFRRISEAQIVEHLKSICRMESIESEEAALRTIARAARGSLRDALGMLDQISSSTGTTTPAPTTTTTVAPTTTTTVAPTTTTTTGQEVTLKDVQHVLGAVEVEALAEIAEALAHEETGRALSATHRLLVSGTDVLDLIDQLSEYLRDLLVASYCEPDDELLAGAAAEPEALRSGSEMFTPDQLTYMIQMLREAKQRARRDTTGRLALELAVIKMSRLSELVPIEEALRQLSEEPPRACTRPEDEGRPRQPGSRGSQAAGVLRKIKEKLNNPQRSAVQTSQAPAGIDEVKFRQIQRLAGDASVAEELAQDEGLLKQFVEADKRLGLLPENLRRLVSPEESAGAETDEDRSEE